MRLLICVSPWKVAPRIAAAALSPMRRAPYVVMKPCARATDRRCVTAHGLASAMTLPLMSALGIALGTVIPANYPGDHTDEFVLFALALCTCRRRYLLKRAASSGKS